MFAPKKREDRRQITIINQTYIEINNEAKN